MTSIVALIPARAGSKGVPDKNTRLLGGYPLIAWSIAACLKSRRIGRTIVSTDSEVYAAVARGAGAEAPFLRPAAISGDRSTDYEFIVHALDWLAAHSEEPQTVVHIRPTTPLRDPTLVDQAIDAFAAAPDATALRSIHPMSESAYKTFEIGPQGLLQRLGAPGETLDAANNARQQFPTTYMANGYVDVLSTAFIRRHGLIHGARVLPFVTPVVTEVDTLDDFARLEFELAQSPSILQQLFA
jgi:CMP-N,N'-diacetyllegionaminic acid synthase